MQPLLRLSINNYTKGPGTSHEHTIHKTQNGKKMKQNDTKEKKLVEKVKTTRES